MAKWAEYRTAFSIDEYAHLWDSINGVGAWALNPWVWVIEFKKVEAANGDH